MHSTKESPPSSGFWEGRTGWRQLKQLLFLEPLPGGARWSAAFGSLLLFAFVLQILTGILLATNYAPSVESAWPSVNYIQQEVPFGDVIRGIHHWGSSAMVVLLLFHLVQVFVWGAYKKPRELTWMVGVLLLVCILGLAFTGYLLPWDQKAYWATKVGLSIASTTPLIGDNLRTLLQGGSQMGNLTLTRFFTLHTFLLPGLVIVLIVVHLYLFRLHGVTPSWWHSEEQLKAKEEPFWPRQVLMDVVLSLVFLVGLGLWVYFNPAPLEAQADPSKPYEARPEWYFMFLFQLLRYFEGPYEVVGTFVLPTLFVLILLFWPFLDRNPHRNPLRRPLAMTLLGLGTVGLVGLTIFAVATDVRMREPATAAAQTPAATRDADAIRWADVAGLYKENCSACHGIDGNPRTIRAGMPTIPDFTSMAWQLSQTDLEITHRIQDGNDPMPSYRDKLTPRQMMALAVYIRAFAVGSSPVTLGPSQTADLKPSTKVVVVAHMESIQVYRANCLACHDADGRGNTVRTKGMKDIPDFTSATWQDSRKDADLKHAILEGKKPFMAPMKDRLGEADAAKLVALVRDFRSGKKTVDLEPQKPLGTEELPRPKILPDKNLPVVKPELTKPSLQSAERLRVASGLYRQYCLSCHGANGKGAEIKAAMPTIPDFTSRPWQESVSNPQAMVGIREGKGAFMPAFQDRLSNAQTQDLVAYLRAFGPVRVAGPEVSSNEFERRFRELQDQWDELRRQLQELKKPGKK